MGNLQAAEYARLAATGLIDLDAALAAHLGSNHYPPIPLSMIPACQAAIQAIRDDDLDRRIDLPAGVTWQGHTAAPAHKLADHAHLWAFAADWEPDPPEEPEGDEEPDEDQADDGDGEPDLEPERD